jgi:hypothetical protein
MQQFSFIDPFIDLFKSALMELQFRLNLVTGWQQYQCIVPKLYIQSKVILKMGEFVARNI